MKRCHNAPRGFCGFVCVVSTRQSGIGKGERTSRAKIRAVRKPIMNGLEIESFSTLIPSIDCNTDGRKGSALNTLRPQGERSVWCNDCVTLTVGQSALPHFFCSHLRSRRPVHDASSSPSARFGLARFDEALTLTHTYVLSALCASLLRLALVYSGRSGFSGTN